MRRDLVQKGIVRMVKLSTHSNPSGLLTKALPTPKFQRFAAMMVTFAQAAARRGMGIVTTVAGWR